MKRTDLLIIGMGLIGGSIAKTLATRGDGHYRLLAADRDSKALDKAKREGLIEEGWPDIKEAAKYADIAVLCVPVRSIPELIRGIAPFMPAGSVITDVGSVKGFLLEQITDSLPPGVSYVAAHPMAGSEKSGLDAAEAGLFKDRPFVVIPSKNATKAAADKVFELAEALEAKVMLMPAAEHDLAVAMVSHLPHVVAAALMLTAAEDHITSEAKELSAGCFSDMTRVAGADVRMWTDICLTNKDAIAGQFAKLHDVLLKAVEHIKAGDERWIEDFFTQAREKRAAFGFNAPVKGVLRK